MRWWSLIAIAALYLCSHLVRMMRLGLLTLDEREKASALISAHILTAFPSSFLPFKIGEVLRLAAFLHVFEMRQKALAVWLAERFGDVVVITFFIVGLYFLNVPVPVAMRTILVVFVIVSTMGLAGMFAVAKTFVYLNRHLVLASHSRRGLALLRASYRVKRLELDIVKSIDGRFLGFVFLSVLVWVVEISALSMYINQFEIGETDWGLLFSAGLLASLPGSAAVANNFGLYQSLALVGLTFAFLMVVWCANHLSLQKV